MNEPFCKCGHGKTWHRYQGGACIHPIGVRDDDCDCKGYALLEPSPTLRDQFAMAALTGLLAYPGRMIPVTDKSYGFEQFNVEFLEHRRQISERVYQLADAMLATREKKS